MVEWSTALVTPSPAAFTASAYPTILSLHNTAVATVSIFPAIESGILVPPNNQILKPGATTTIPNGVIIAVQQSPPAIFYRDDQIINTTAPSTFVATAVASTFVTVSIPTTVAPTSAMSMVVGLSPPPNATFSMTAKQNDNANQYKLANIFETGFASFLIGFLFCIFLVCFTFRDEPSDSHDIDLEKESYRSSMQGGLLSDSERPGSATPGHLLPEPPNERAISEEMLFLKNWIKTHVQTWYHSNQVNSALIDEQDIQILGDDMPISSEKLCDLLQDPDNREAALRFYIGWVLVNGMDMSVAHPHSFLPSGIFFCKQQIVNIEDPSTYHTELAKQWRMITAKLTQSYYSQGVNSPSNHPDAEIRATVDVLDNALQPYADVGMANEQRKRDLENLLKHALSFALKLYSYEGCWVFDWKKSQTSESDTLCIYPALMQRERCGQPLIPAFQLSIASVVRLDG